MISVPEQLLKATDELVSYKLIDKKGRELFAHRVVQEAMIDKNTPEVQEYFDSASSLVYEAFPKQVDGNYLASQWEFCEAYISHSAQLSRHFGRFRCSTARKLKGYVRVVVWLM